MDVTLLKPSVALRADCTPYACGEYNKNWACPTGAGDIDKCASEMKAYNSGVILQYEKKLNDSFDKTALSDGAKAFQSAKRKFFAELRKTDTLAMLLEPGACDVCPECSYPKKCRFPLQRTYSLEGMGLNIKDICAFNYVPCGFGEQCYTFCCVLLYNDNNTKVAKQ